MGATGIGVVVSRSNFLLFIIESIHLNVFAHVGHVSNVTVTWVTT